MGQHTWFYKEKSVYDIVEANWEKLDKLEDEDQVNSDEYNELWTETNNLSDENDTDYHDLFRNNKRNADRTYTDDKLFSHKETIEYLKNEKIPITKHALQRLHDFWDEYPNGVIDFG